MGGYKSHAFTPHYCKCHLYSPWPAYTGHMHCHGHDVCMLGVAISPYCCMHAVDDTSLEERVDTQLIGQSCLKQTNNQATHQTVT